MQFRLLVPVSILMCLAFSQLSFADSESASATTAESASASASATATTTESESKSGITLDKVLGCTGVQNPTHLYHTRYTLKMYGDHSFSLVGLFTGPYANEHQEISGNGKPLDANHEFPMDLYQYMLGRKIYIGSLLVTSSFKT